MIPVHKNSRHAVNSMFLPHFYVKPLFGIVFLQIVTNEIGYIRKNFSIYPKTARY